MLQRLWVTGEGRILELSQCYLSSGEESRRLEEVAVVSLPNVARKRFDSHSTAWRNGGEHGCGQNTPSVWILYKGWCQIMVQAKCHRYHIFYLTQAEQGGYLFMSSSSKLLLLCVRKSCSHDGNKGRV